MKPKLPINGLWVPLITPFLHGQLDKKSLVDLVKTIEPYVDGFVPCLSSGEGGSMSDNVWEEVITTVVANTDKPVVAGILDASIEKIVRLSEKAKSLKCVAVAIPLQGSLAEEQKVFCQELSSKTHLPVILYNTEKVHIDSIDTLKDVAQFSNIVALKDSSQNQEFFSEVLKAKKEEGLSLSILQGMENQLLESTGCDGYLIALANVEPKLCRDMFNNPSKELNAEVMKKWHEFNLASETWFIGLKRVLYSRGTIKSAELIS